jgi:hypothetical protein
MSNYTVADSGIKRLTASDPGFYIDVNFVRTGRAGIFISQRCPENYKHLIEECVNHGWIKPVAHVTEKEYLWMNLANDN